MEDRRHTKPWQSARPSGSAAARSRASTITEDPDTTVKSTLAPPPSGGEDERLRGMSVDGRFRIDECIGVGGMSRVYSGTHNQTGVRVAIKLIDPALSGDPSTKQRLLGEARAMMELQSSHIVRAHDVGALPSGQLYVVMELLTGDNLDVLLTREGPLPWPRVAAIGAQICSGLATAHHKHIIHRDIKPQNCIRTTVDGNPEHIKIIDFGVAREVKIEAGPTEQGVLPGTPDYMAPELVTQRGMRANERSDLYAVGVTLYKLLTGVLPFHGATYMETLRRHVSEPLTPPSRAAPALAIPPEADALLAKLLAKDPAARFASAEELAAALRTSARTPDPHAAADVQADHRPPSSGMASKPNQVSTLIPPNVLGDLPVVATVPAPSHTLRDPLDRRFVLLRVSTLMLVSVLFALGTFAIRPSAAPKTPTVGKTTTAPPLVTSPDTPLPSATAASTTASEPPRPPEPTNAGNVEPATATPTPGRDDPAGSATTGATPPPELPPPDATTAEPPTAEPPTAEPPTNTPPTPPTDPVIVDPEQPPEPPVQPESAPTTPPEPDFPYNAARTLIKEQHVYLRTECLGKRPKRPLTKLKFIAYVRPNGLATIRVVANDKNVRACVRKLFDFPLVRSPRGGAFEYTLTMTTGILKPVPVDPEQVK